MKVNGTIVHIANVQVISDKFSKQEFVVETTDDTYPQKILLQCVNDKLEKLESVKVGDQVEASINLRGREWVSPEGVVKYFNTISCWNLVLVNSEFVENEEEIPPAEIEEEETNDLPF